ncbi:glycine cleavage system protein H [Candidatus Desantisbacteria bacterium CG1_02_38_46]|uniref:Glycine cleavage system H protein n=3 Tax=unclassified Candidatus Desantisiibacteriota TaxID=3106372 RepID=A0A2H9PCW9_9BACT|nr:MAG: glycine cleavage system protein H [Candidatus Desantisbacteria bacterium CG1_02_38_46]PIU52199.1 MAG: glycine cleavage system protein H [Candidatus Desantisbacteria bacterium CG07_land_8_20_14_0_80_39_15]PIZ17196.1 MAG: glycine cleavage system protein H [Candidatus Desantisbacteria bacterium CG_4_10_14_0_8_um_filter_39_17]
MNPEELKYAKTHEWVRVEGDVAAMGITDFAVKQLGDIVFLELPQTGKKVVKGEPFGVIESVKAASDLHSLVSGEIIEVNKELIENLKMLADSPYQDGWMIKAKMENPAELDGLINAEEYGNLIKGEENQ